MTKEQTFKKVFLTLMKFSLAQLILWVTFAEMSLANPITAQELLDKRISLTVDNKEVKLVISKIEKQADVKFMYSPQAINTNRKVSLTADNLRLEEVLKNLFLPMNVEFEIVGRQIILRKTYDRSATDLQPNRQEAITKITGKVTDENGSGMPGVNIQEKGTTNGATTDAQGDYTITVQNESSILVFSFIGYISQEVPAGNNTRLDVQLKADVQSLNEVVIIGYGSRDKKDITGAVSDIKAIEIQKSVALTPELAMQGRIPGVFVQNGGGDPNARPVVRIRGVTTFGNNANPLYVIDGVPIVEYGQGATVAVSGARADDLRGSQNIFNLISSNDIESISVLKDASSAAVYGVRAANGVILITTKRGKEGKPRITFNASKGIQNIRKKIDVLNTQQYAELYQEAYANNPQPNMTLAQVQGKVYDPNLPDYLGKGPTYDRQDEIINKNAVNENYNIGISGGTALNNYYISAGYNRQESSLKFNYQERYTFAANSDHKLKKWLEVGESFRLAYTDLYDNRYNTGNLATAAFAPAWQPLYDSTTPTGFATYSVSKYGNESKNNFLAFDKYTSNKEALVRSLGSGYVTFIPVTGLRIKGIVSVDYFTNKRTQWSKNGILTDYSISTSASDGNFYGERYTSTFNLNREVNINYNKSFGEHNFDILLIGSDQKISWNGEEATVKKIPLDDPATYTISNGDNTTLTGSSFKETKSLQTYVARLSYKYSDKYYIDAVFNRSGSSNFAPDYRWGSFPSVSAAWRISRENFMDGIAWLSDLKLRAGIGTLGNQDTQAFAFTSTVNRNPAYSLGGGASTGAILGNLPNKLLTWEKITTQNIGVDGSFFNNALSVTLEYYNRKTEDILQSANLAATTGLTSQRTFNIASVRNKGIELVVGYRGKVGDFQYNVGGNFTTVKNVVLSTYSGQPIPGSINNTLIGEGHSINSIYGYRTEGIFQTNQEVTDWLAAHKSATVDGVVVNSDNIAQLAPGDVRFVDIHSKPNGQGSPDGVVNTNDQDYLGKTIPGYFYGLTLGGSYKGFDISILFQGIGDVQKINTLRVQSEGDINAKGNNVISAIYDRWTTSKPSGSQPRVAYSDPSRNSRFSDRYVENGGFLRLNNLQLGYNVPKNMLGKIGVLEGFRIYLQTTNTFVITKYKGLDPENDINPVPRAFLIGINATF